MSQKIHLAITPKGGWAATKKAIALALALKEASKQIDHVNSNTSYSGIEAGL